MEIAIGLEIGTRDHFPSQSWDAIWIRTYVGPVHAVMVSVTSFVHPSWCVWKTVFLCFARLRWFLHTFLFYITS